LIPGESDLVTDNNLNVKLDLGTELSDSQESGSNRKGVLIALLSFSLTGFILYKILSGRKAKQHDAYIYRHPNHNPTKTNPHAVLDINGNINTGNQHFAEKGHAFEKYIVSKFHRGYFTLLHWRSDKFHEGVYAESNKDPDLEYLFHTSYQKVGFAVECKWRSSFINGKIEWAKCYQLNNYRKYEMTSNKKVFVIIGVGGKPENPRSIYIVPLNEIHSTVLLEQELKKFYRYKTGTFFLNTSRMTLE
jgi:hypothetical protein